MFFEDLAEQMLDGSQVINLPAAEAVQLVNFTNKGLDRLVAKLGKSKALWRRVLVLHEWLLLVGHTPDTRLCTTVREIPSSSTPAGWRPVQTGAHQTLLYPVYQECSQTCSWFY